jgi:Na+-transporting methylmalonyl-CoA/oxaloacetate decarboxylase gamma subunit
MGTELITILPTGLFVLFVLVMLVALVYSLARLIKDAGAREDATPGAQGQQRFLQSSFLHVMNRAGR